MYSMYIAAIMLHLGSYLANLKPITLGRQTAAASSPVPCVRGSNDNPGYYNPKISILTAAPSSDPLAATGKDGDSTAAAVVVVQKLIPDRTFLNIYELQNPKIIVLYVVKKRHLSDFEALNVRNAWSGGDASAWEPFHSRGLHRLTPAQIGI